MISNSFSSRKLFGNSTFRRNASRHTEIIFEKNIRYLSTQKVRYNIRNINIILNNKSNSLFLVEEQNRKNIYPKKDTLTLISGHQSYDEKYTKESCKKLKEYMDSNKSVYDFISDTLYNFNRLSLGYVEIFRSRNETTDQIPTYKGSPHWQSQMNLATMQNINVKSPRVRVVILGMNIGVIFKNKTITILEGDKKSFLGDHIRKNSVEMTNAIFNFENPDLILIGNYEIFSKLSEDNIVQAMKRFYENRKFNVPEYLYSKHGGEGASIGSYKIN